MIRVNAICKLLYSADVANHLFTTAVCHDTCFARDNTLPPIDRQVQPLRDNRTLWTAIEIDRVEHHNESEPDMKPCEQERDQWHREKLEMSQERREILVDEGIKVEDCPSPEEDN